MSSADETYRKMFTVSWQELHRDCKALAWKLVAGGPWRDDRPHLRYRRSARQALGLGAARAGAADRRSLILV